MIQLRLTLGALYYDEISDDEISYDGIFHEEVFRDEIVHDELSDDEFPDDKVSGNHRYNKKASIILVEKSVNTVGVHLLHHK